MYEIFINNVKWQNTHLVQNHIKTELNSEVSKLEYVRVLYIILHFFTHIVSTAIAHL